MKKRRQFHCNECGAACEIYRKGKRHRVLICPNCGILATNPLPLLAAAAPSLIKGAVGIGKKALGAVGLMKKSTPTTTTDTPARQVITNRYDNLDKYNSKDKVELALR